MSNLNLEKSGNFFLRGDNTNRIKNLICQIKKEFTLLSAIFKNQGEIDARLQMIVNRHVWGIENNEVREMIDEVRKMRETGKY